MTIDFGQYVTENPKPAGKIDFSAYASGAADANKPALISRKDSILSALAIPQSNAAGMTRSFGRGLTLGLTDVAGEALNAAINSGITGKTFSEQFAADRNQANLERDQFRKDSPYLSYGSEIAGAALPAALLASAVPANPYTSAVAGEGATLLGKAGIGLGNMAKTAAVAVPQGAIYGAAESDAGKAAEGAKTGAEIAGAVGAASVPIAAAAGKISGEFIAPAASNLWNRVAKTPEEKARGFIANKLEQAGISPEEAANKLTAWGEDATLSDISRGLMRAEKLSTNSSAAARDKVEGELIARQAKQAGETTGVLSKVLGGVGRDDVSDLLKKTTDEQMAKSSPLYESSLKNEVPASDQLLKLSVLKPFKDAQKDAGKYSADIDTVQIVRDPINGDYAIPRTLTGAEKLHNTKRALFDAEAAAYGKGQNEYAADIARVRHAVTDELDKLPGYQEARQIYAGAEADKRAVEVGMKIEAMPTRLFNDAVGDMSDSERQHALYGVMSALAEKIGGRSDSENMAGKLIRNPNIREKLSNFVDSSGMEELVKNASKWDAFTARRNLIRTGNVTHEMQMAEAADSGIAGMIANPKLAAAKIFVQDAISPFRINEQTAPYIANALGKSGWSKGELVNYLAEPQKTLPAGIAGEALSLPSSISNNPNLLSLQPIIDITAPKGRKRK